MKQSSSEFSILSKPSVYVKKRSIEESNEKENKKIKKEEKIKSSSSLIAVKKENKFYEENKFETPIDLFSIDNSIDDKKINLSSDQIFSISNVLSLNFSQDDKNHPFYEEIISNENENEQSCSLICKEKL